MDLSKFECTRSKDRSHKKKFLKKGLKCVKKMEIAESIESCNFESHGSYVNSQESIKKSINCICTPKPKICNKVGKDVENEETKEESLVELVKRRCGKGKVRSHKDRQSCKSYSEKQSIKTIVEEENSEKSYEEELMCKYTI